MSEATLRLLESLFASMKVILFFLSNKEVPRLASILVKLSWSKPLMWVLKELKLSKEDILEARDRAQKKLRLSDELEEAWHVLAELSQP